MLLEWLNLGFDAHTNELGDVVEESYELLDLAIQLLKECDATHQDFFDTFLSRTHVSTYPTFSLCFLSQKVIEPNEQLTRVNSFALMDSSFIIDALNSFWACSVFLVASL